MRRWHFALGERLAVDAEQRRASLLARGWVASAASVTDGRARQAQAHRLLRAAMNTAVTDGLIDAHPCRIPGATTPRLALRMVPDIADLTLDTDLPGVRVRRGVRHSESGVIRTDLPKTTASVRSASLPGLLATVLTGHLEMFVGPEPEAPVFTTSMGTLPARSNVNATFRRVLGKAEVPQVRFHDLRHVAQVFAAEAGATLPELMARLGHATPAAALVYLHARVERDQALTDALSAAMATATQRD